ncbi:alpha/beta fold hydrolase [Cellulomonas dongxiuzhuiae]|uniref:Alpha/beta hydrolase n=1 Tax=Cellulomonas dongxiuzhuiae TaxID=2819979 RepID=A0ABX8GJF6_9CELL|nr:alpha/beta hydrolase [Cellulomonas dongxiuzhuiae]MBO3094990.1 alpha/beta hydrolase [Cellulomonas dongxiuzhuiae]QWC16007.1 alpha/beta hydrolase [Cellulomonas dongxiuzhuiae]
MSADVTGALTPTDALAVHRSGDPGAPTVVLVHGLTDSGTTWPDLLAHWGDRYHVVAPDLRGHGSSPRFTPEQLPQAPEVMLADVVALLDAQPAPVFLMGHSLGGLLGLRAALARPEKVRALVVEDPAKPTGVRTPDPQFSAMMLGQTHVVIEDRDAEVARMRRETPWSDTEIDAWAATRADVDQEYLRVGLFLGDAAWEEAFGALQVPTLLVLPEEAPMAPRADGFDNPLVRTVVVPGAGHCVRRDQPDAFHAAVDGFLAEHAA